jgi:hypothetical protein
LFSHLPSRSRQIFSTKKVDLPLLRRRGSFCFKEELNMNVDRRKFVTHVPLVIATVTAAACGKSPTQPSAPEAPTQQPPVSNPPSQPIAYPQSACWGTRIGEVRTSDSWGTLRDVMVGSGISHQVVYNNSERGHQLVSIDGVTPAIGIIVLVEGKYAERGIDDIRLAPRQTWAAYSFNGRSPNAQGNC